jgi:predicted Ser/Thr protein kinase
VKRFLLLSAGVAFVHGSVQSAWAEGEKENKCAVIVAAQQLPEGNEIVPGADSKAGAKASAKSETAKAVNPAAESLSLLSKLGSEFSDNDAVILSERHDLKEFLTTDPAKNLAIKAPFTVMNAAQRMLGLIYSQGVETVRIPTTNEQVSLFHFFSSGSELTKGKRIIGNESAINDFVNNIEQQARGDRSGSSIVLLVGSHGTGKSEFLTILGEGAEKLTKPADSKFATYTFEWTKLEEIPTLLQYLTATKSGDKTVYPNMAAPLGDSPFTLFPTEVQNLILENSSSAASALMNGMTPSPVRKPDPISQFIRAEIIQHESLKKGKGLTASEIVDALSKHVVIKRMVMGRSGGRMPLIDAQGNDIDVAGLFMTPNPVVRFASGAGPSHVMAWYLNGKVLQGHGNAVLFDEFFRNPEELRNMLLGAFESRVLSVGGAPTVPFDAVMIAATNTANLDDISAEGKGAAAADRFKIVPMRWPVDPHQVAQVMLLGKTADLHQQALNSEETEAPVENGNMDKLLPRRDSLANFKTPDGRYRLWYGSGEKRVTIAPHTLMVMAEIVSASRMKTDPNDMKTIGFSGKIGMSAIYRDPISRINLFEGLSPQVNASEISELHTVSLLLKEGETGISARDAAKWLSEALDQARSPQYGYTLTPGLAMRVYRSMLKKGSIRYASTKERVTWDGLGSQVVSKLLIPRLESDISKAMASGDRVVHDAYFEMLEEFFAIDQDPAARTYTSSSSRQERAIDKIRLEAVLEIFKKKNGRDLSIHKIAMFHAQQNNAGTGVGREPDRGLYDSVAEYYAKLNTQVAGINSLIEHARSGNGNDEVRSIYSSLMKSLYGLGYNETAARDALNLVQMVRSQEAQ